MRGELQVKILKIFTSNYLLFCNSRIHVLRYEKVSTFQCLISTRRLIFIFSRKNCFIEYSQTAQDVTVEICRATLIKDCEAEGPEVCSTEYESECETVQHPHDVEDDVVECRTEVEEKCEDETSGYTTNTKCSQWPREVCDVSKKSVTKYTPDTQCSKVRRKLTYLCLLTVYKKNSLFDSMKTYSKDIL